MQPRQTFLTLERFRQLLGLSVLDFYGVSLQLCGHQIMGGCPSEPWVRDNEQASDNTLSWSHLLVAIESAEREIANYLNKPLGRSWVCEKVAWPNGADVATFLIDSNFVAAGQRIDTLIGTANKGVELTFQDLDGDGFSEQATIIYTDAALDGVNSCDIEFRYDGNYITPQNVSISGTTVTAVFLSFQLLDPTQFNGLFLSYPIEICCDGCDPLDVFVDTVDIYTVTNDPTATQASICSVVDGNGNCNCGGDDPCTPECEDGCIIDLGNGLIRVSPATPDGSGGFTPSSTCGLSCPPTYAELFYQVNPCPEFTCNDTNCNNLCPEYETAIIALAAARLKKLCSCQCDDSRIVWYQREMGSADSSFSYPAQSVSFEQINVAPFGMLYGEVYAYQVLKNYTDTKTGIVMV